MKSDVFDNFVKIAQEKGMISNDSEDSKKKLEKTHRADSLDISAIEALYGVKPNAPKDMEYERNIIEDAHPNSVVISPSYDKLNGLVENENERQNINLHIVHKNPDGLLTQRKYAEKDLVLSLVRIANDLDNNGQENLRILADTCLMQASQPMTKTAIGPIAIGPIAIGLAVAAVIGGIYLKEHMKFISDGFEKDNQKLVAEIDDLIESNESTQTTLGAGYTYKPEFIQQMQDFKSKLTSYFNLYQRITPYIDKLEKPRTASELKELAAKPKTGDVIKAYKAFRAATDQILPYLTKIEQDFDSEGYKQRQIADKGWAMSLVDAPQFLHGGKGLIADDFDDVYHALKTYMSDIQGIMKALKSAESLEQSAANEIEQASFKSTEMFGPDKTEEEGTASPTKSPPTGTFVSAPKTVEEIDQGAQSLEEELKGLGLSI